MNTKLKDILLYSLAAIGVCSLFIAASNSPLQTTTPAAHVWDKIQTQEGASYIYNKKTGEVRILTKYLPIKGKYQVLKPQ